MSYGCYKHKKNVFAMLWGTDLEGYFEFYFVMPSAIAQHRLQTWDHSFPGFFSITVSAYISLCSLTESLYE